MKTKLIQKTAMLLVAFAMTNAYDATAQDRDPYQDDPFRQGPEETPRGEEQPSNLPISVAYEIFTLPLEFAAALQREQPSDGALYKKLVAGLKDGTVKQETLSNIRTSNGMRSTNRATSEYIYPTEYTPAAFPQSVEVGVKAVPQKSGEGSEGQAPAAEPARGANLAQTTSINGLISPATPGSFDTAELGETIEIEAILNSDNKSVFLTIAPSEKLLVGQSTFGQGLNETTMPLFETRLMTTQLNMPLGKPTLLGTLNRPSNSKVDPDSPKTVSYAFVTCVLALP